MERTEDEQSVWLCGRQGAGSMVAHCKMRHCAMVVFTVGLMYGHFAGSTLNRGEAVELTAAVVAPSLVIRQMK